MKRIMKLKFTILGLLALPIFAQTPLICNGSISGPINANVDVPAGATCVLNGPLDVHGAITVEGALYAYGVNLYGPLSATGSDTVYLAPSQNGLTPTTVAGDVTLKGTKWFWVTGIWGGGINGYTKVNGNITATDGSGEFSVTYTTVGGNLSVSGQNANLAGYPVYLYSAHVGMNATFNNNTGEGVKLLGSQIGKNLNCGGNSVVAGQGNTVGQHANGQCSSIPGLIVTPPPAPAH